MVLEFYSFVYQCIEGIWKRAAVDEHDHKHDAETESQAGVSFLFFSFFFFVQGTNKLSKRKNVA